MMRMLSFTMMNENDLYNADQVCNENFSYLANNVLPSKKMTRAAYTALTTKDADTLYVVIDGTKVMLYLGELPVAGGGTQNGVMTSLQQGLSGGTTGAATNI